MMRQEQDTVLHPGEYLFQVIGFKNKDEDETIFFQKLALSVQKIGVCPACLDKLFKGKIPMEKELADKLEQAGYGSSVLWMEMQKRYDEKIAESTG